MAELAQKNGITENNVNIPAPDSIRLSNSVEATSNDYIVAQMRVEVSKGDNSLYSFHTGPIMPNEAKAVFFNLDKDHTFNLVIETNHVTTWASKQWNVLHELVVEEKSSRNFIMHGTPGEFFLHALSNSDV